MSPRVAAYARDHPQHWGVVAGGSDGIGAAWAEALAAEGLSVLLVARRTAPLEALAASLRRQHGGRVPGQTFLTLSLDLATVTSEDVSDRILGARDVRFLVYNAAATGHRGPFADGPIEGALTAVDVNVRGVARLTHAFVTRLKAADKPGGVVLMSSLSGILGTGYVAHYAATKSYITSLARGLFYELRPAGVDVLACVAGATTTPTYLKAVKAAGGARRRFIEQDASSVVHECLSTLGRASSVETGWLNKLTRGIFVRLLPQDWAVAVFSDQAGRQMGLSG